MRIVGIMLVRDEDRFVEWAIRSAIDFCDEFLVCDHESEDQTSVILARLSREYGGKLTVRRTRRSGDSHHMVAGYANTSTWIFGVDGDEIYDTAGLARLRLRLEAGEFANWWAVFGSVLNVKRLDLDQGCAAGHLAPPCRSMTKLYNFAAIESWGGRVVERLHGGEIHFRSGYDETLRLKLHERSAWEDADFRCLHLCFLERSSRDPAGCGPRRNIMDRHARSLAKAWAGLRQMLGGRSVVTWKDEKYAQGPLVTKSIEAFLSTRR